MTHATRALLLLPSMESTRGTFQLADYQFFSLLHGLRKVMGPGVTEHPRVKAFYREGTPQSKDKMRKRCPECASMRPTCTCVCGSSFALKRIKLIH